MPKLKYLSARNTKGFIENVPFTYFVEVPKSVLIDSKRYNFKENFELCFSQVPPCVPFGSPVGDPLNSFNWDLKVKKTERIVHLAMDYILHERSACDELLRYKPKNRRFSTSILSPKILKYLQTKNTLGVLLENSKKVIATYKNQASKGPTYQGLEGIGFILDSNSISIWGDFSRDFFEDNLGDFNYAGRFFQDDELRGLDFHLSFKKYNDMIREGKIK